MKVLACYSNKGGVGKTAAAVNLSYALSAAGVRTLLCDLDPQGASSFYFRIGPSKKLSDTSFFSNEKKLFNAIKESDYTHLDVLPANSSFRDFDILLSQMKKNRTSIKKTLKPLKNQYDVVVLDCPPNISILSENVFAAAHIILVPVIPSTLSQRTFEQLMDFFETHDLPGHKVYGFFSMVQSIKSLHTRTLTNMRTAFGSRMLLSQIPFASDVERMGVHRAPVIATAPRCPASDAYLSLCEEVMRLVFDQTNR